MSNSAKFSAGRPVPLAYDFSATMATTYSTYHLGAVASVNFWQSKICPHSSAYVCYGQAAGWIRIPLGTEVGLSPGYNVLDGDPSSPRKGAQQPVLFSACLLWPNGWMDQDTTWYGGMSRPKQHCVRWGPSSPTQRGTAPSLFSKPLWPTSPQARILPVTRIVH